ncbi:MAG: hypothetical protein ACLR76_04930 [Alistipes sp.]
MKKVVFAAAVLAAIVSATGTASAVSSSVFPITAQEGFIRIAPSDLPQAVRDALDKISRQLRRGSLLRCCRKPYKVIVKKSDGWSATIILDKEGFIRQASETPAA